MELRNRTVGLRQQFQITSSCRSQSKVLIAITNAPQYVTNHTVHTDLNMPYVSDVIHRRINEHHNKMEAHPNPLLQSLLQLINSRRLKRCWHLDLQGT